MRIAFFTNNYLPNPYGVSTSVDGFYRGLQELGHDVSIFAPHWNGDESSDDKNIFRYPSVDVPTKVPFSLALPYSPEIDNIIEEKNFDLIHAQHPNILGTQAKRWARKKNVPLVFTWHSLYDRYAHYATLIPERIASKWVMDNAAHFASLADHVIFPTPSAFHSLRRHVEHDRISIVSSGVDEDLFADPQPKHIRQKYQIPADAKLLVTVSRLSEEKNVLFLARSIRRFLRDHENAYFLFCGDGDLREELEALFGQDLLGSRVIFPGKIPRDHVKHYLSASDVFVYASTSETQGTIITEAMYCGVPIVAVRSNGVRDVVEDGVSGILTREVGSDFVFALNKIVYDRDFRRQLSEAASVQAHQKYTVTMCTRELMRAYEGVVQDFSSAKSL